MEESKEKLPTRYIIQEKHFTSDDKYVITDESGGVYYRVDSTLFSLGDKLLLYDAAGNELIKIRQENLHLHQTYNIHSVRNDADEMRLASIKRTGLPGHHKLEISAVNGEYIMKKRGGVFSHEFTLTKDDNVVAVVTKDTAPTKSVYWVDVSNERDEYHGFIMAMVLVLACAEHLPGNPLATTHSGFESFHK